MVKSVSTLGRNGLHDWLIQRVSAVVLLVWVLFIAGFLLSHPGLYYATWSGLFAHTSVKAFTLTAMLALCAHAWIGLWTVSTDYLTPMMLGAKATAIRLLFQLAVLAVLLAYLIWCIQILWSY